MKISPVCNGNSCPDRYDCERYLSRGTKNVGVLDGKVQMAVKGGCSSFLEAEQTPKNRRTCTGCGLKGN